MPAEGAVAEAASSAASGAKEGAKEGAEAAGKAANEGAASAAEGAGGSSGGEGSAGGESGGESAPKGEDGNSPDVSKGDAEKKQKPKLPSMNGDMSEGDDWEPDKGNKTGKLVGGIAGGIAGQILIPVPVLGSAIGSALGEALGSIVEFFVKMSIIIALLVGLIASVWIYKGIAGSLENNQTTRYSEDPLQGTKRAKDTDTFMGSNDTLDEFDYRYPMQKGLETYVDGIEGEPDTGLKDAMEKAIANKCLGMIYALGDDKVSKVYAWNFIDAIWSKIKTWATRFNRQMKGYNLQKSLETFYENRWPYDKGNAKIGDFIASVAPESYVKGNAALSKYKRNFKPKYDDVNWIEILSVFSMNTKYDWNNINYDEFNEYIHSDENQFKYFEMGVKWKVAYAGSTEEDHDFGDGRHGQCVVKEYILPNEFDTEDDLAAYIKSNPVLTKWKCSHGYTLYLRPKYYFCKITVKPFGLRELYDLAGVSPDGYYQVANKNGRGDEKGDVSFYQHKNRDMLDYNELWTRTYLRHKDKAGGFSVGGPPYNKERSKDSPIYNDLNKCKDKNQPKKWDNKKTGRSDWYYIKKVQTYDKNMIDPHAVFETKEPEVVLPDVSDMVDGYDELTDEQKAFVAKVVTYAEAAVGCPYDQGKRMQEGYFDCSSLAWRACNFAGLNCGQTTWALTSVGWYNWGLEHGVLVEGGNLMIPGTILVTEPGNIHHVLVCVGGGYIVEARGAKWGVVRCHYTERAPLREGRYYAIYPWMLV